MLWSSMEKGTTKPPWTSWMFNFGGFTDSPHLHKQETRGLDTIQATSLSLVATSLLSKKVPRQREICKKSWNQEKSWEITGFRKFSNYSQIWHIRTVYRIFVPLFGENSHCNLLPFLKRNTSGPAKNKINKQNNETHAICILKAL